MTQAWDFIDAHVLWAKRKYVSDMQVTELELSKRGRSVLNYAAVDTIGQLVQLTEADLLRFPNCGRKTVAEIQEALANFGLHLGHRRSWNYDLEEDDYNLIKEINTY